MTVRLVNSLTTQRRYYSIGRKKQNKKALGFQALRLVPRPKRVPVPRNYGQVIVDSVSELAGVQKYTTHSIRVETNVTEASI